MTLMPLILLFYAAICSAAVYAVPMPLRYAITLMLDAADDAIADALFADAFCFSPLLLLLPLSPAFCLMR